MDKFLKNAAQRIVSKHGNNLSDITVLFPNHRSCTYFRQALKDIAEDSIWSPEITTFQDFIISKSELALIEPMEQLLLLFNVYQKNGGGRIIDEFFPTAEIMLSDFNEVDLQLADANLFFRNLEMLKSMSVYEPGETVLSEYSLQYRGFWKTFRELYFAFREELLKQKKGYAGMIFRDVAEKISSFTISSEKIYIVGFSGLNKAEEKIVSYLLLENAEIIWDSDKYYVDELQEAGLFFRKYKKQFRLKDVSWQNDLIATTEKKIHVIGTAKNFGQAKVVADILQNKLELSEEEERKTAVIIPDVKLLSPIFSALPDSISALNISMGLPLTETKVAELLQILFSVRDNVERFCGETPKYIRFYYRDVFDLLQHPYAGFIIENKRNVSEFVKRMKHYNQMLITVEELYKAFGKEAVEKLFWFTTHTGEFLNKLLTLIESLRRIALRKTKTGELDLTIDIEFLYCVYMLLNNLQNVFSNNTAQLSIKSMQNLLTQMIRSTRIPFEGEPVKGVQLMGVLETQCLDFKNVIMVSMNEGIFPSGKNQKTYIPYEMRKEFLTTHKEKDAVSAYLFYRLMGRAENIYLIYNTEPDELGGGEKSRFIIQLQHELADRNQNITFTEQIYSVDPPATFPDNSIIIRKDETLIKTLTKSLTGYGISPSAINSFINCSLQYYFRYAAKLSEQDDMEESIEAATLGSAVHHVLENLYSEVVEKQMTKKFVESIQKNKVRIETLLKEYLRKRYDDDSLRRGKNYLLYKVCLKLIDEFLHNEVKRLEELENAGSIMKIRLLETEMSHPVTVGIHRVIIRGKVDRVEEIDQVINIVDYKTGSPRGSNIKTDDMNALSDDPKYAKAVQLLSYAWLYFRNHNPENISMRSGIYWLRKSSEGFDALQVDKNEERILGQETLLQFEEVLRKILSELLNPEIPFTKTDDVKRCANCDFATICGRD